MSNLAALRTQFITIEPVQSQAPSQTKAAPLNHAQQELANQQLIEKIQQLQTEVEKWKTRAERDHLTGCLRRESFMELVSQRIKQGWMPQNASIAIIDLDHFKKINDTFGHLAGDAVLAETGKILRQHLGPQSLVCRAGGEEFVVMIPRDISESRVEIENLRKVISETYVLDDRAQKIAFTASIGLTSWNTQQAMLVATAKADAALYEAKKGGRNRVILAKQ